MMTDPETIATYNIQILDQGVADDPFVLVKDRLLSNLPAMLEAVEEDLNDLLPQGYTARITEWCDDPKEDPA